VNEDEIKKNWCIELKTWGIIKGYCKVVKNGKEEYELKLFDNSPEGVKSTLDKLNRYIIFKKIEEMNKNG